MKKKFSFVLCLLIVLLCFCSCAPQAASDGTSDGSTDLAADATQTEKKLPQNPPYGPQPYTYDRENRTVLSDEELSRIPSADVTGAWIYRDSDDGDEVSFSKNFPYSYPCTKVEDAVPPENVRNCYLLNGKKVWGTYKSTMRAAHDAGTTYHVYTVDGGGTFGLTEDGKLCTYRYPAKGDAPYQGDLDRVLSRGKMIYEELSGMESSRVIAEQRMDDSGGCVIYLYNYAFLPREAFVDGTPMATSYELVFDKRQQTPFSLTYFPKEYSDEMRNVEVATAGIAAAIQETRFMVEQQGKAFRRVSAKYSGHFIGEDGELYGIYTVSFALTDELPQLLTTCQVACRLTGENAVG